ncbi:MAG: lysylphosphatidylglycerol synthase domain-containing protein [Rickettsiales bacterium]|nr:lysylphosphatidylglycerol synthase domain-containing protein [Rickettsiales bacterium]
MKKVLNYAGLAFFIMAVVAIYSQLSRYSWEDIRAAVMAVSGKSMLLAVLACTAGYAVLACYDWLALKYIGRRLAAWKWLLVGFLGFAISNNAGTAVVSGGAIRYRLYTRWKFRMAEIVKMVTFSGFTYLVGCLCLVSIGYFMVPDNMRETPAVALAFPPCFASFVAYFALAKWYKKGIRIAGETFKMPSVKMAAAQSALGTMDSLCASLVLYSVLYPFVPVPFDVYVGVFVISQVLGVFTPVPGALGVFEGLFMLLLPGAKGNEAAVFGALIVYRVIYYLIPLALAGLVMMFGPAYVRYHRRRRHRNKS